MRLFTSNIEYNFELGVTRMSLMGGSRHSRLIGFTTKQNLHDFRYEGGAPINSGSQIPVVIDKKECGPSQQARTI